MVSPTPGTAYSPTPRAGEAASPPAAAQGGRGLVLSSIATTILIWGFAFVPLKRLTNSELTPHPLSPEAFLFLRFVPFLLLLLVLLARHARRERPEHLRRDWPLMALMGLLIVPAYHLPLNLALRTPLHTGLLSLIVNLSPVITYGLAVGLGQERPRRARTVGVTLAFLGVAAIFLEEVIHNGAGGGRAMFSWAGAGWGLVSCASWSVYTPLRRRLAPRHDSRFVFSASGTAGTLAVLLLAPALLPRDAFHQYAALTAIDWASWAYVSLLSSFFAYWAWLLALTRYEASRLASTANLVPVLVHVSAAIFLPGERNAFTPSYLVGAALAVLGTTLVLREPRA